MRGGVLVGQGFNGWYPLKIPMQPYKVEFLSDGFGQLNGEVEYIG